MKTSLKDRSRTRGILLLEVLVYIGLFFVVTGLATAVFWSLWDASKAFWHDADDVSRSLQAGERWRADVRAATGPIQVVDGPGGSETLRIPQGPAEVDYTFAGSVLRRDAAKGHGLVLSNIKTSRMFAESRPWGAVWRWELELSTRKLHAHVDPLFTFSAAAAGRGSNEH